MSEPVKLTSELWAWLYRLQFVVLDPDGWNRDERFSFEWNEELLTEDQFMNRVASSTCQFYVSPLDHRPIDFQKVVIELLSFTKHTGDMIPMRVGNLSIGKTGFGFDAEWSQLSRDLPSGNHDLFILLKAKP